MAGEAPPAKSRQTSKKVAKSIDSWQLSFGRSIEMNLYFSVSANALPSLAFDACEPAQKGTAISAKSF